MVERPPGDPSPGGPLKHLRSLLPVTVVVLVSLLAVGYIVAGVPVTWLIGLTVAGAALSVAALTYDELLIRYHELRAWRRKQQFDCWMRIGDQLLDTQDYDRATYWYRRLVDEYPSSVEAWYRLATCLEDAQAFVEASHAYQKAHEVTSGGDGGFLASAAKCAWQADERDRAADLFSSLARRDPQFASKVLNRDEYESLLADERVRDHLIDEEHGSPTPYT